MMRAGEKVEAGKKGLIKKEIQTDVSKGTIEKAQKGQVGRYMDGWMERGMGG